eukprot:scaffold635_cov535-Prasinococcus_capsulatus_cf.AAC.10
MSKGGNCLLRPPAPAAPSCSTRRRHMAKPSERISGESVGRPSAGGYGRRGGSDSNSNRSHVITAAATAQMCSRGRHRARATPRAPPSPLLGPKIAQIGPSFGRIGPNWADFGRVRWGEDCLGNVRACEPAGAAPRSERASVFVRLRPVRRLPLKRPVARPSPSTCSGGPGRVPQPRRATPPSGEARARLGPKRAASGPESAGKGPLFDPKLGALANLDEAVQASQAADGSVRHEATLRRSRSAAASATALGAAATYILTAPAGLLLTGTLQVHGQPPPATAAGVSQAHVRWFSGAQHARCPLLDFPSRAVGWPCDAAALPTGNKVIAFVAYTRRSPAMLPPAQCRYRARGAPATGLDIFAAHMPEARFIRPVRLLLAGFIVLLAKPMSAASQEASAADIVPITSGGRRAGGDLALAVIGLDTGDDDRPSRLMVQTRVSSDAGAYHQKFCTDS